MTEVLMVGQVDSHVRMMRIETITPEQAAKILDRKGTNRSLNRRTVNAYATDMRAGAWHVNGSTVVLSSSGACLDGQHRLAACVCAGVPFTTIVLQVDGDESAVMDTIDVGRKRSVGDTLAIRGIPNYNTVAGSLTVMRSYEQRTYPWKGAPALPTKRVILDVLDRHPGLVGAARWYADVSRKSTNLLPARFAVFCRYAFHCANARDGDLFMDQLFTGEAVTSDDCVFWLRNRLLKVESLAARGKATRSGASRFSFLPLLWTIKSWNYHIDGKLLKVHKMIQGEDMPRINGFDVGIPTNGFHADD